MKLSHLSIVLLFLILFSFLVLALVACTPLPIEVTEVLTETPTLDPTPTQEVWTEVPTAPDCSRLSYNINAQQIPNYDYLMGHLSRLNPCYVFVMDGLNLAVDIAGRTGAAVIHRDWSSHEGNEWLHISPQQLVDKWVRQGHPDIIRYTTNEPSVFDGNIVDFLAYEEQVMRLARGYGFTVSVGNFGVGRYQPHWINEGIFDNWLRSVVVYGHIIGIHEYTIGLLPFGVGQMPAEYLLDRTMIQPSNWASASSLPTSRIPFPASAFSVGDLIPFGISEYIKTLEDYEISAQASNMILPPYWHLRRGDWFLIRADELGIERPTIVLTEAFWDNMDDVAVVRDQLRTRYGIDKYMDDMRGINSLERLWAYYFPSWSPSTAACHQLMWAEEIYPEDYAGFAMFTWSTNRDWIAFDLSGNQNGWIYQLHQFLENRTC